MSPFKYVTYIESEVSLPSHLLFSRIIQVNKSPRSLVLQRSNG